MLHLAHFGSIGGNRSFAALCTKIGSAGKAEFAPD
jgi:hypothetical protein